MFVTLMLGHRSPLLLMSLFALSQTSLSELKIYIVEWNYLPVREYPLRQRTKPRTHAFWLWKMVCALPQNKRHRVRIRDGQELMLMIVVSEGKAMEKW